MQCGDAVNALHLLLGGGKYRTNKKLLLYSDVPPSFKTLVFLGRLKIKTNQ